MTSANEQTFADGRESPVDSELWSRVVDAVLPGAWATALERRLSAADAALVCDATLLGLLETWGHATYAIDESLSLSSLAVAVRRRAGVECDRITQLNQRRSVAAVSTVDLTDQLQPEGVQR